MFNRFPKRAKPEVDTDFGVANAFAMAERHMKPYFITLATVLFLLPACSRHITGLYTEDDVRKFVLPGTPLTDIIQRFGQPWHDEKNPKFADGSTNIDEIVYFNLPSPPPGTKEHYAFCGFVVQLRNGKAVTWDSTHLSMN